MRLVLLALAALPAAAQLSNLAVTDDGRLFFATNLRLRTEPDQDFQSKIYRLTSEGFSRVASPPMGGGIIPPQLSQPFTSGDGSITGHWEYAGCGSPSCGLAGLPRNRVHIEGVMLAVSTPLERGHVSRNARYFLAQKWPFGAIMIDLATHKIWEPPANSFPFDTLAIGNDGSALLLDVADPSAPGGSLPIAVWHPDRGIQPIAATGFVTGAISPDGRFVAVQRTVGDVRELVLVPLDGGPARVLARGRDASFRPSFSNYGTLLYLDEQGQPTILEAGAEPRRLLTLEEGAQNAILAGGGRLAWVLTKSGRLLRVAALDGGFDTFLPETPVGRIAFAGSVPGSVVRLLGTGFSRDTEVALGSTPAYITEVEPETMTFQIPWDYPAPDRFEAVMLTGKDNPFEQRLQTSIQRNPYISFERAIRSQQSPAPLQLAHNDFRGLVTAEDPAAPGETLHLFAGNLGPVDRPVATGEPGPGDPPARVKLEFACYLREFRDGGRVVGVAVPFAGLAGGVVGVYQIDFTVPEDWAAGESIVSCTSGNLGDSGSLAVGGRR